MALTDIQNEFLKLQLANNPEFMAQYFPNVITEGPSGPLYDVDIRRDRPANVFYDHPVYDSTALGDMANKIRSPHEPFEPKKGAEFRDINVPYDTKGSRLNIIGEPASGIARIIPPSMYYKGKPRTGGQTSAIYMHPDIMKSYGTAPSSPRNEIVDTPKWYKQFEDWFGVDVPETMDQAHINDVIESILTHEVGHGVGAKKDYIETTAGAIGTSPSWFEDMLKGEPQSIGPDPYYGYSPYNQEELYNRMKDIEKIKMENPDDYEEHPLWDLYQKRARKQFGTTFWNPSYKFEDYQKKIQPFVADYFKNVEDKISGITPINVRKRKIGMPEHLTPSYEGVDLRIPRAEKANIEDIAIETLPIQRGGDAGVAEAIAAQDRAEKKAAIQEAISRQIGTSRGDGSQRSMPTGTAGRNPWGRAHGGLIDIPLSGRSRYI